MFPPDTHYCYAHSELMRTLGQIEANQEALCKQVAEIKHILEERAREVKREARDTIELNTKTKLLLGALGIIFVALISYGTNYLMQRVFG